MNRNVFVGNFARNLLNEYDNFKNGNSYDDKFNNIFNNLNNDAIDFLDNKLSLIKNNKSLNYSSKSNISNDVSSDIFDYFKGFSYSTNKDNPFYEFHKSNHDDKDVLNIERNDNIYYFYGLLNDEEKKWLDESILSYQEDMQLIERNIQVAKNCFVLEKKMMKKFMGGKWFGIYGSESFVSSLYTCIDVLSILGYNKFVVCMSHRGRLASIVNVFGYDCDQFINAYQKGKFNDQFNDVIYHYGHSYKSKLQNGKDVEFHMLHNPSHLEAIYPVACGYQKNLDQDSITIVTHGDAAFVGQGVTYETANITQIDEYKSNGVLHLIFNNQLGFTAQAKQGRAVKRSSDVFRGFNIPTISVNGYNPEEVVKACDLASRYIKKFKKDIIVEINAARMLGHNEGDEPRFTNPEIYSYFEKITQINGDYIYKSDEIKPCAHIIEEIKYQEIKNNTFKDIDFNDTFDQLCKYPKDFNAHKNIARSIHDTQITINKAELLCYAYLLQSGIDIRISGEDAERGTFAHRHAIIHDQDNFETFNRLKQFENNSNITVVSSPLSEYGVLGFEFGYSLLNINDLNIWEAQFGDFANGGQIIFDQFIMSAKYKWNQHSNLVVMLPHGYDGQGPEHSSSRIERFLKLCANDNVYVCNATTPANHYHALLRQVKGTERRPLIMFTHKSLLRHKDCVSDMDDIKNGQFKEFIYTPVENSTHLVVCSGKIHYSLINNDVSVLSIEQLYPLDIKSIENIILKYKTVVFCQEEPLNMGPYEYLSRYINFNYTYARKAIPAPIGFDKSLFNIEQDEIIASACKNKTENSLNLKDIK